jgi:hypothetical protein
LLLPPSPALRAAATSLKREAIGSARLRRGGKPTSALESLIPPFQTARSAQTQKPSS